MVLALPEALLMRLHFREEMLGTPGEAILAFDAEGCLLGANQAARRFFALPDGQPLAGGFAALFDCDFRRVAGLPRRDAAAYLSLRCRNGVALFGRVEWSKGRAASAVPAARPLLPRRSAATAAPEFWLDPSLELVLDKAQRALSRNLPVLVSGETGTGKEVVARTLHQRCHGADAPFVAVNCASVPEGLIESELFGYVDGAFSGARRGGAMGKLEQANGGTLFLDEIGDMPLGLQARLLRVLQERVVTRLGAAKPTKLHFSLICATHRELRERVASGDFREDLYYRISGLNIALPALRAGRDVDGLIGHLLAREAERWGVMRLHPAARSLLLAYSWPGNVRELAHVLRSAAALAADEGEISVWHLPEDLVQAAQAALADGGEDGCSVGLPTLQELEAVAIRQAFAAHRGNISAAARSLGISRVTLYDKLRRLGLITLAN
jgi:transcriptional regulator of acetoin/glycerol metabolism